MKAITWTRRNKLLVGSGGLVLVLVAVVLVLWSVGILGESQSSDSATNSNSLLTANSNNPLSAGINSPLAATSDGMIVYRAFPALKREILEQDYNGYFTSEMVLFPYYTPSNYGIRDFLKCDGQLLPETYITSLFYLLGTTYGGDGKGKFAIPTLTEKSPLNGLTYYICVDGTFPSLGGNNVTPPSPVIKYVAFKNVDLRDFYLGEIVLAKNVDEKKYAGTILPCDGREIKIPDNQALYSLIDNIFGGKLPTTFRIPDLSGVQSPVNGAKYYIIINSVFPPIGQ